MQTPRRRADARVHKGRAMRAGLVMLMLSAVVLAGCGVPPPIVPGDPEPPSPAPSPSPAPAITVAMTGPVEVPPGDPDGTGTAAITLDAVKGEVCVDFTVTNIDAATAAHIHTGGAGVAGPVVVDLPVPATGTASGCVPAEAALIQAILADPSGHYVNVHNLAYPKGAVRAQLGDGPAATVASGGSAAHCSLRLA